MDVVGGGDGNSPWLGPESQVQEGVENFYGAGATGVAGVPGASSATCKAGKPIRYTDDKKKRDAVTKKRKHYGKLLVDTGGNKVHCLNDGRKMVMRADQATTTCIEEWMVLLLMYQAPMIDENLAESPEDGVSTAGFQFVGNPTPNIRDKVMGE